MPYFPRVEETSYTCPGCGGAFQRGHVNCCVAHPPGTCCHYGEVRVDGLQPRKATQVKPGVWVADRSESIFAPKERIK